MKKILATTLGMIFLLPVFAHAATLYFEPSAKTVGVNDTVLVDVKLDTGHDTLNAVDGTIHIGSPASVAEVSGFSIAGSAFDTWVQEPTLSPDGASISFVGGVPGGISESSATLFTMTVKTHSAGSLDLSFGTTSAYINDGKGTLADVRTKDLHAPIGTSKNTGSRSHLALILIGALLLGIIGGIVSYTKRTK